MEQTLGIVKPNAVRQNQIGKILSLIEQEGLRIVEVRMTTLTKTQAEGFYAEHRVRPFFSSLISFMTQGPVLLFVLEADGAIERYRKVMGATDPAKAAPMTIRRLYGESIEANSVHGSDSPESAKREISYLFG